MDAGAVPVRGRQPSAVDGLSTWLVVGLGLLLAVCGNAWLWRQCIEIVSFISPSPALHNTPPPPALQTCNFPCTRNPSSQQQ
jgi:hypothetical protein